MAIEIKVPEMGESIIDAIVGSWLKSEGEAVAIGETLLELETDKVNLEVTAEADGVLSGITAKEGDTVTVGDVLGTIEAGATATAPPAPASAEPPAASPEPEPANAPAPAPAAPSAPSAPTVPAAPSPATAAEPTSPAGGRATPVIVRMADDYGIRIADVQGTGPAGRITRDDLMAHLARHQGSAAAPAAAGMAAAPASVPKDTAADEAAGRIERIRLSRRRQTIAKRLVEAQQNAAMLTTFNEVDMTAINKVRARRKDAFKEAHGVGLGFMSFFTKATVGALKAFPDVNAEMDGDSLLMKTFYDIGIAVGAEEGLVVPVIRDADRKSFAQIEAEIKELAGRARDGKLALEELQGGSFTITNGGIFGSLMSTPILNTPQVGILGMHGIKERPIVVDGEIQIRPMMYLALSYDHRVVDGSTAVRFLVKIKEMIEDPETLLIEG